MRRMRSKDTDDDDDDDDDDDNVRCVWWYCTLYIELMSDALLINCYDEIKARNTSEAGGM
jgi:hypothetical protein